jgi:histidinol-phosphate aminotransferase
MLITSIARSHFVNEDRVAVGNGTEELILTLALARRADDRPALVTGGTARNYAKSLRAAGIPVVEQPLVDYRIGAEELCLRLERGAGLAFVSNPHDPTGSVLSRDSVRLLCRAARRNNALVVFDEEYAEYALGPEFTSARWWASNGSNVCVVRTFSQAYGLGSSPVSYLIGEPAVVAQVKSRSNPVNRVAQAAACEALSDRDLLDRTRRDNHAAREMLCRSLERLGITYFPPAANFVLVKLPETVSHFAAELRNVRDTSDLGLAGHFRVRIGGRDEVAALLEDLDHIIANRSVGTPT